MSNGNLFTLNRLQLQHFPLEFALQQFKKVTSKSIILVVAWQGQTRQLLPPPPAYMSVNHLLYSIAPALAVTLELLVVFIAILPSTTTTTLDTYIGISSIAKGRYALRPYVPTLPAISSTSSVFANERTQLRKKIESNIESCTSMSYHKKITTPYYCNDDKITQVTTFIINHLKRTIFDPLSKITVPML